MNFIAQTDRFARQIEAWKQGHGFSDLDALKDLMEIWHEFINLPERKAVSYAGSTGEIPLVDYKCGKCGPLTDALTLIYSWRQHLVNEVTVDFKGVPQAEVVVEGAKSSEEATDLAQDESIYEKSDSEDLPFDKKTDYTSMKMHQLRSIAKKNPNVVYTNKTTKEELIRLING